MLIQQSKLPKNSFSAIFSFKGFPIGGHQFITLPNKFFISPNELEFSKQHPANYHLYRFYRFYGDTKTAKAFVLTGDLSNQISLFPTQFKAVISD